MLQYLKNIYKTSFKEIWNCIMGAVSKYSSKFCTLYFHQVSKSYHQAIRDFFRLWEVSTPLPRHVWRQDMSQLSDLWKMPFQLKRLVTPTFICNINKYVTDLFLFPLKVSFMKFENNILHKNLVEELFCRS